MRLSNHTTISGENAHTTYYLLTLICPDGKELSIPIICILSDLQMTFSEDADRLNFYRCSIPFIDAYISRMSSWEFHSVIEPQKETVQKQTRYVQKKYVFGNNKSNVGTLYLDFVRNDNILPHG